MITVRDADLADLETLRARRDLDVPSIHASAWAAFEIDGEVVAVWGLVLRWAHVAELCGVVDHAKLNRRHRFSFVRESRRLLSSAAYELQLRRVTAYVDATESVHRRFAEGAGFAPEGIMAGAGPRGGDIIIYWRGFPWATSSLRYSVEELPSRQPPHPLPHPLPLPRPLLPHHPRPTTARCGRTTVSGPVKLGSATTPT